MSQCMVKILEEYRNVQHLAVAIVIRLFYYSEVCRGEAQSWNHRGEGKGPPVPLQVR